MNKRSRLWQLAWPLIVANATVPLLGLVDAAILGHLNSANYLAAVAVGTAILSFIYWGFGFLRMGTTGLTATRFGESGGAGAETGLVLFQALQMALFIAALILLLRSLLASWGLAIMNPGSEVAPLASSYVSIRLLSAPAVLCSYVISGWMIGQQQTRWLMAFVGLSNGVNIVLDYLFVIVMDWNSDGAAWASVVAEYTALLLAVVVARRTLGTAWMQYLRNSFSFSADTVDQYRRLLTANAHLFVRTLFLLFSFAFFTHQGSQLGANVVAANTVLINLLMLLSYGLDGFANASESMVGEATGRRKMEEFFAACRACFFWSVNGAILFTAFLWISGSWIPGLFTDIDTVLDEIHNHHTWLVALPMLTVASYCFDGIFIGAGKTRAMRDSIVVSVLLIYLPIWYLTREWGNHGLWLAFCAFSAARSISLGLVFVTYSRRDGWLSPRNESTT